MALVGACVAWVATAPPVHAAEGDPGCVVPGQVDEELAQQFETELRDVWLEFNDDSTVDATASLTDLLGFPGTYDLPPGELIVSAVEQDLQQTECPDGDSSKLEGECVGMAMSFDADGRLLDIAADLDPDGAPIDMIESRAEGSAVQAFTRDNPFQVDVDGFVAYVGKAGEPGAGPRNHSWSIESFGVALDSGGDPNTDGKNRNAGAVDLAGDLPAPAKVDAVFRIEGQLTSDNGITCDGQGYFETSGGLPLADGVGVVLLVGAGLGAFFNARPARTWKG